PIMGGTGNKLTHHRQLRHRAWLYRGDIPDPDSRYRRRRVLHLRSRRCLARADDHGLDRDRSFGRRGPAAAGMLVSAAGTALRLVCARHDPQGTHGFRRTESWLIPELHDWSGGQMASVAVRRDPVSVPAWSIFIGRVFFLSAVAPFRPFLN